MSEWSFPGQPDAEYPGEIDPQERPPSEREPVDTTVECDGCNGNGIFYGRGRVENGKFVGFTGPCFRCGGKGRQDEADVRRNRAYDAHRRYVA